MSDSPALAILSAPEDASFVRRLSADLSAAGYRVHDIASERLHEDPCSEPSELRRRLEPARAMLVIVSPHAISSEQVRCEIEFARLLDPPGGSLRLVPLLLAPADMPYSLKSLDAVSFTDGPYEGALRRLMTTIAGPTGVADDPVRAAASAQPDVVAAAPASATPEPGVPATAAAVERAPLPSVPAKPTPAVEVAVGGVAAAAPSLVMRASGGSTSGAAMAPSAPPRRRSFWRALFGRKD